MASNGIEMRVDDVRSLANNDVHSLTGAVQGMAKYAAEVGGLKAEHFGGLGSRSAAASATLGAIDALAKSVTTAQNFLTSAATALAQAAGAQKKTDEDAAASIFKAGQGS